MGSIVGGLAQELLQVHSWTCSQDVAERSVSSSGNGNIDVCCVLREGCVQGGTYRFWVALQSSPPLVMALLTFVVFAVYPNKIIAQLPLMVPGLRIKFQCKKKPERDDSATEPGRTTVSEKVFMNPKEAEDYEATGKVLFQLEAYNRILHPDQRILLLCILFPVLYSGIYIWDKAVVRKVGYVAFPEQPCMDAYDCYWTSDPYLFFSWPVYHPLDCQGSSRLSPPEAADFYQCFKVVLSCRMVIGALADAGSLLVIVIVIICYKSSAPAHLSARASAGVAGGDGRRHLAELEARLRRGTCWQRLNMSVMFAGAALSVPVMLWCYGKYVNSMESLGIAPAVLTFFGFLSMSQYRVHHWLLTRLETIPKRAGQAGQAGPPTAESVRRRIERMNLEDSEINAQVMSTFFKMILDDTDGDMPAAMKKAVRTLFNGQTVQANASLYDFMLCRKNTPMPTTLDTTPEGRTGPIISRLASDTGFFEACEDERLLSEPLRGS
mmetsp:Transcript_26027/g.82243  ORF Transcript_26027/g.82243 Transcript_26027/m.82243 type:complete len:494 (+) Transcript_26027:26-1507(+)